MGTGTQEMRGQGRCAGALIALAAKAEKRGDYARARRHYEQALAMRREHRGAADPLVAEILDKLGAVLNTLGDYAAARDCHEEALAIGRAIFGEEHPAVARSLNGLGRLAAQRSDHETAWGCIERALAIRREAFGEEHPDTAESLNDLGVVAVILGKYEAAREYFELALAIRRRILGEEHSAAVSSLYNLGVVAANLGDYAAARRYYEQALAIERRARGGDHPDVAWSLHSLGVVSACLGDYAAARSYYEQALAIRPQALGEEHPDVAATLHNLGVVSGHLGDYAAERSYSERALAIRRRALGEEHPDVAATLHNLGVVSGQLGDYPAARQYYDRALAIRRRALGDEHPEVAATIHNLGVISGYLGNHSEERSYYEQALVIRRRALGEEHPHLSSTLHNLGVVSEQLGDGAAALDYYEQALAIRKRALGEEHPDVAQSLNALAELYRKKGDLDRSAGFLEEALRISMLPDNVVRLPETYHGLSALNAAIGATAAAIFFAKQAVNAIQHQRARMTELDPELQRTFIATKEHTYRHLADLLVGAGRLGEAQQVLAMLKEEELFELLRCDTVSDPRLTFAQLTGLEAEWQRHGDELGQDLARLTGEIAALRQKPERNAVDEARLRAARDALDEAGRRFRVWVTAVRTEMTENREHAEQVAALNLEAVGALQADLRALGREVALVHYLVGEMRLSIILTTAGFQLGRDALVSAKTLNRLVHELRMAIDQRLDDTELLAQTLYRHLVEPIAPLLDEAGIRTLMLVPYGTLRYLPFAALHDGEHHLAERYAIAILTPAAHSKIKDPPLAERRVAGFGVTREVPGYLRLNTVEAELKRIVRIAGANEGVYPGTLRLDEEFTEDAFAEALESHEAIHVASHFVFLAGQEWGSYLLLGDGSQLTLERLRDSRFDFAGIELMTLSACETAMGGGRASGREFESFGALVQQRGAKAVIASLWAVADASTPTFMEHFYRGLQQGLSKAAALRAAQLALLDSSGSAEGDYSHPYHWAPFVLMGNWL
jgi:CHAT domain-containing protein/Tfp pilus assembly protein PilF